MKRMIKASEEDQKQQVIAELKSYLKGEHPYTVRSIQEVIDILEKSKGSERACVTDVSHFMSTYEQLLTIMELSLEVADTIEDMTGLRPYIGYKGTGKNTPFVVVVSLPYTASISGGIVPNPNKLNRDYTGKVDSAVDEIINSFSKILKKSYKTVGSNMNPEGFATYLIDHSDSNQVSNSIKLQSWIESLISATYQRNKNKNTIPTALRKEFDRLWNFVEGDPDEFMFSFEDLMNLDPSDRPAVYHKYPNYEDYAEIYLKEKES